VTLVIVAALAYLVGSIPFAVLVSRAFALPDPRGYGSGNPGATNVLRTGRKLPAALTLLGDAAKGWVAVVLAQHYGAGAGADAALFAAVAAVGATLGHVYSVFLRFEGGKGVSTALGVTLALSPYIALGAVATWILIALFFRISSLAALVSAAFVPFFAFLLHGMNRLALEPAIALTLISLLLVWRHKANIRNLIAGTESRIGRRTASGPVEDADRTAGGR